MLYVMHGNEIEKARTKTRDLTDTLRKKRPDALFYRITSQKFEEQPLEFLVAGQGLFESKYIVFYDNLFESKEIKEKVVDALEEIAASENVFIFLEKELDKKTLAKFEKHATKIQNFEETTKKAKISFNPFGISDALVSRDKKKLWTTLLEAKKQGSAAEEIHGIIWWQVKSLKLATESQTAEQAGLSPFVFSKAKAGAKNFDEKELATLAHELVTMYHDAHRGEVDLWNELEKFALKV
jgi:DNA polymerase III delta subunit